MKFHTFGAIAFTCLGAMLACSEAGDGGAFIDGSENPSVDGSGSDSGGALSGGPDVGTGASGVVGEAGGSPGSGGSPFMSEFPPLPTRLQAQDYDDAFPETDERRGATTGLCAEGLVDLDDTTDNDGGCVVGWTAPGEWIEFQVFNPEATVYDFILRISGNSSGKTVSVSIDGAPVGDVDGSAAGWDTYSDRKLGEVSIAAGEHTVRITFDTGGVNFNYVDVVQHEPPAVTPPGTTPGTLPETGEFVHPGVYSTKNQLDFVKAKIEAGESPWAEAFDALVATDPTSRTLTARAIVPGSSDPQERKDMDEMTKDGEYANAAALLWYFTGEQRYAEHAIETLNAWSVFQRTGMPLYLTWAVPHFINAAEIMKHVPGSGWGDDDIAAFSEMVESQMWPKVQLPPVEFGSNHAATANESMFAIAIFLDDQAKFDQAVDDYYWLLPRYVFLDRNGRFDGETNETCRDLNHMKLGMTGIMNAAENAWSQGVDLYGPDLERFQIFAEFHSGIMTGVDDVPANLCAWKSGQAGRVYCKGSVPWSSPGGSPPCNQTAWDMLINHLGERWGASIPKTRAMAADHRPVGSINRRTQKWETLLKHGVGEMR